MQLIKPNVEIWKPESYSIESGLRHIERCARVCYASADRITEDSYKKFVGNIIKSGHLSVTEHGTFYLTIPIGSPLSDMYYVKKHDLVNFFSTNPYSVCIKSKVYNTVNETPEEFKEFASQCGPAILYYITTNYRVLLENKLTELVLPYMVDKPAESHEKRVTVHWVISRGIADEFARHRVFSFSMQSTRYCNYSKDKFGNELTFVEPSWYANTKIWLQANYTIQLESAETAYMKLTKEGLKPQEARDVLPLGIKTELVQTGTVKQWNEFFKLRCSTAAHPDAQYIANQLKTLMNGN